MPCSRTMSQQQQRERWLVPPTPAVVVGEKERAREADGIETSSRNIAMVSRFTLQGTEGRSS